LRRKYLKLAVGLLLLFITIGTLSIAWVNTQLKKAHGGYTAVLESDGLIDPTTNVLIKNVNILSTDCSEFMPNLSS